MLFKSSKSAALLVATGSAVDISRPRATFPYSIYAKWADTYEKDTGDGLTYQSIGSGGGVKQIKAMSAGARSRPRARLGRRSGHQRAPVALPSSVLHGLIGHPPVMAAVRPRTRRLNAAVAEFRSGGVAERPAAHRLLQLDDRDPQRHRHDDVFVEHRLGLDGRVDRIRQGGVSPHHRTASAGRSACDRRPGRGRGSLTYARGRGGGRFCAARQAKSMNFADDRVAGDACTKFRRDLACALAVEPKLTQKLDPFIRPRHFGLIF